MNPLNPNQLLRILENGYFMTHQEQADAAQYIRQLQQENLALLGKTECDVTGKPWVGLTHEEAQDIAKRLVDDVAYCSTHYAIAIEVALRKKNT